VADEQTTLTQWWRCREDFTEAGRRVVAQAHLHAYAHHSDHVGTEHFLLALDENYEGRLRICYSALESLVRTFVAG